MPEPQWIIDVASLDFGRVVADLDRIRAVNPQRFEFEQLSAVVVEDFQRNLCVGYKDLGQDEFWARGHFPGMPIMPGVLQCEAAAQLCSYFACRGNLTAGKPLVFAALDNVRFYKPVQPPCRLVIVVQMTKVRKGVMMTSQFQCIVNQSCVSEGKITGVAMREAE